MTKSGASQMHGSGFEFLRNTALDAKNFFDPTVEAYRQNQFGGTVGGPVVQNKMFFFADYQGTRTTQGISTGRIPVPTLADRSGNFLNDPADPNDILIQLLATGCNSGPCTVSTCNVPSTCLATQLSNNLSSATGSPITVSPGEPYYTIGCANYTQCVFPNGTFPFAAWSAQPEHLLQYIPAPNSGGSNFSAGSDLELVRDDKGSMRVDTGTTRWGRLSVYYFYDNFFVNNPYPTGQGGALFRIQRAESRNSAIAQPRQRQDIWLHWCERVSCELHAELQQRGTARRRSRAQPRVARIPNRCRKRKASFHWTRPSRGSKILIFNSFVVGTPTTNLKQANDTYTVSNDFSKVIGKHTIKTGVELIFDQINVKPNPEFNGGFTFNGSQTGSDFVDFLVGAPNLYNQADSQAYYPRHKYVGGFGQDSWQIKSNLTLNYGLRWDLMQYWSEKYNQIPTFIPGEQSKVYPDAPVGLVYPTDSGVPNTLVPQKNRFSPRLVLLTPRTQQMDCSAGFLADPEKRAFVQATEYFIQ